ncbi:MAG TPA: ABC transporter permease [Terriglobales bacterium]|jgi:predicted permease
MNGLLQDVRYALRQLRKSPGFTAVAVITLALGIGANTAIFSVVKGVVLAPLPFRQPDRLVVLWENNLTLKHLIDASYPDFLDWQRNARSFEQTAAISFQGFDLTNPGQPEHVNGKEVSAGFFGTLGVKLQMGRDFSPEEDKRGGAPGAIISDRLWKERFGQSPTALGKSVTLDGVDYTIVGILAPGFHFVGEDADVYTPLGQGDPLVYGDRTVHPIFSIGRLKDGVSLVQAQGEMNAVQGALDRIYPAADRGLDTDVMPLKEAFVGNAGGTLLLLLGAVAIVLLIACANVANFLLTKSAARSREFAIRSALGASRGRMERQLITESVLLSLAGGSLGLAIAKWGVHASLAVLPAGLPRSENIHVDAVVLLFAFAVSITVGILFGLAPASKSSKIDLQTALKEGERGSRHSQHRTQSCLVVFQIALTLVLLSGAGLLFRTIRHLGTVDPGFEAQHVITFKVGLSPSAMKTGPGMRIAYQQLVERIRQIPGVQSSDLTVLLPFSNQSNVGPFWAGSHAPASIAEAPRALFYWTGPDYLKTMSVPLLRGRFFTPEDTIKSERVIVIDSALAHAYFASKDPVGETMTIPHWGRARVIGVVGHVKQWGLDDRNRYTVNQIYASLYQLSDEWVPLLYRSTTVIVRTSLATATVMPAIKAAVYGAGNGPPVYDVQTMRELVFESMSAQRFPMILLGMFAGLALLLAAIGIYGVISYSVAQRAHEIGIRMALGAEKGKVFRMVIGETLRLGIVGLAIGVAATLALARMLTSFSRLLYGVNASDPVTLAAVSCVAIGVAVLGCYIPARRAAKVDPMVALRYE